MIAGLEQCIQRPITILAALVALTAVALVLLPGVAVAREEAATPLAQGLVASGDSLWSISQERLGPGAPQQRVALEVRRIHELNRDRIGDDPSLIFPGQRLSLPPLAGEPAKEPVTAIPVARPSKPSNRDAARTASQEAPEQRARPAPASPEAVPRARPLPAPVGSEGSYEAVAERRRLLGFGVLALTLVLAALMAWKLPMRRDVEAREAWWNIPLGYRPYYHGYRHLPDHNHDPGYSPGGPARPEGAPRRSLAPTKPALVASVGAAMMRNKRAGAVEFPRKGLAGAYNPVLVRALRRSSRKRRPAARVGPSLRRMHGRRYGLVRGTRGGIHSGAEDRRGAGIGNTPPPRRVGTTTTKGRV